MTICEFIVQKRLKQEQDQNWNFAATTHNFQLMVYMLAGERRTTRLKVECKEEATVNYAKIKKFSSFIKRAQHTMPPPFLCAIEAALNKA